MEGTDAINTRWNSLDWTIASVGNCRLGWHEDKTCENSETAANARLIASAPELLEYLIYLRNCIELGTSPVMSSVNRAISKATGGAA